MEASANAVALIRQFEGLMLKPYRDAGGLWTVGYGHLLRQTEPVAAITVEEAEALLRADLEDTAAAVDRITAGCDLTQNQFDALVSLVFNIGPGNFGTSTMLKLIQAGDILGASREFPRWDRVHGQVLGALAVRRMRERELFLQAPASVA